VVEEEGRVACRWTLTGTNLGEFGGRPPTGKRIQFHGLNIEWIDEGRFLQHWSIYDSKTLFEHLGLLPPA
jgi:predicted ester cyclase